MTENTTKSIPARTGRRKKAEAPTEPASAPVEPTTAEVPADDVSLTEREDQVLRYLDYRGPTHGEQVVLAVIDGGDPLRAARAHDVARVALALMAQWTKRLQAEGLVLEVRTADDDHRHYEITDAGRAAII